ncbi:hypothetical protein CFE70_006953 [Pyrenophora teres f. teres 0-1]|uniref:DUF7918 domain-containing protein n=1 Tax=Pyrenophora teres f. teres (strain 0-1) TaxID=861557 RepID=E3RUS0_PYRTT|nr:hypothetical protein PTT_12860 [Pyrenophora teres f. teres 0-1]
MAVIPFYPGFKVEILVNDAPLPEYDDIDDTPSPPNSVTKYIEATTGVEFKIRFIINEAFPFLPGHLIASFYFDGEWRRSLLIRSERFYSEIGHTCDSTIAKVEGKVFKQALSFHELQINALRALQIVPPLPPLEERPEEDLTIAELQELVKKLKRDAAERALQKVPDAKPEQDDQDSEGEEEDDLVLVEQKKRKRHCGQHREVIVLD